MTNQARILLFNMNKDRQLSIEKLCRSLSIKTSYIKPAYYSQSLGYLAGIQGFPRNSTQHNEPGFESEMLVFSGMDSELTDRFLKAFKEADLTPIALKAVVTPTNIFWTPVMLYQELKKEHRRFHL